jgi:hypothetical protein
MRIGKSFIIGMALSTICAFSQNPFENCISFDGKETYLTIPNIDVVDSCKQFTIECWLKMNTEDRCVLINKMSMTEWLSPIDTTYLFNGLVVDLNSGFWPYEPGKMPPPISPILSNTVKGQIRAMIYYSQSHGSPGNGGYNTGSNGGSDSLKQTERRDWNHLAFWVDKRGGDRRTETTIINGLIPPGGYGANLVDWELYTTGRPLNWGGYSPDIDTTLYLNGYLDEVRIWNHTRFLKRIRWAMRDTLVSAAYADPDSGLIAYYRFDQLEDLGVGGDGCDDIRDLSGNGRHADIVGNASLVESSILTAVDDLPAIVPLAFGIIQNYPNPFNPYTTIGFTLKRPAHVKLSVYNLLGERIVVLLDQRMAEGFHQVRWDAMNRPSGIYLCRMETGDGIRTIRMLLQK